MLVFSSVTAVAHAQRRVPAAGVPTLDEIERDMAEPTPRK